MFTIRAQSRSGLYLELDGWERKERDRATCVREAKAMSNWSQGWLADGASLDSFTVVVLNARTRKPVVRFRRGRQIGG